MEAALQLAVCARMILTAQGHLSTAGGRKVYLSIASTSGGHPSDSAEMALVYLNCVPNPRHGKMINIKEKSFDSQRAQLVIRKEPFNSQHIRRASFQQCRNGLGVLELCSKSQTWQNDKIRYTMEPSPGHRTM